MSELLYANNATTTLSTGINTAVTLITVASGTGALFPSPAAGQFFVATLVDAATGLFNEIVYVTARTGDAMTVIRAQEGTTPRNWLTGDTFANFWTAGSTFTFFQGQTYAGNPNGNLAGNAGVAGGTQGTVPDVVYDTTNNILWVCTSTGTPTTAVWQAPAGGVSGGYYCGTSTGTANAQTVTPPAALSAVGAGTAISFKVGAALTNTGAMTITIGTIGTFGVDKSGLSGPAALIGGEVVAGNIVSARYDGAQFQLTATALGTAALANASSATGVVVAVIGATVVGHLAQFADIAGTVVEGPIPSSTTGIVASVTGAVAVGHIAVFSDTTGTVQDGGPAGAAPTPTYINTTGTIGPGRWLVDTTVAPISLTITGAALGVGWEFLDAAGTWGAHNLTINTGGLTITPPYALSARAGPVICNISGTDFLLWYTGSTLRAF